MKKIIFLFSCFILLGSCKPPQNVAAGPNFEELWSKPPDLTKVVYTGGDGTSIENAIIISGAGNTRNGIAAEYEYVAKKLGAKSADWKIGGPGTPVPSGENKMNDVTNKEYDVLNFQNVVTNETLTFYFDITDFYGKW